MLDESKTGAGRKADHLRIAGGTDVAHRLPTGLDAIRLRHRALPERDLESVSLRTVLLGHFLEAPVLVSAMTGGTPGSEEVNRRLTRAAGRTGIGLVLGSGRRLLDDPDLLRTYLPPGEPRPPLLLANLGAAQVTGREGAWASEKLVELLDADGLCIHLNALQEAVQPEGQPRFAGVLEGIAAAVDRLAPRPVLVKEVGFGMDFDDFVALRQAGVAAVDVAGAGGTNWALIEGRRDAGASGMAAAFADWGVSTVDAIGEARAAVPGLPIIASGGLHDGVEVAKCLALGATAAGLARVFLLAAQADRVQDTIHTILEQLRIATWLSGVGSTAELSGRQLR